MGTKKWAQEIFKYDTSKIDWCDVVVAVVDFDDDDVDSGTAFEIGYAYSTNKPLVIFMKRHYFEFNGVRKLKGTLNY
ncbi:nucleoside 2-deoxyribosyltransferase [Lentilactobacillus senioris]|uniref:nucleoside 2-deoxyribosyltransferase n=1 Tax=Lentilactobacillus senioris TaxID=931534 RepID=UPI000B0675D9|nr:nucleoside 2-deoxyribosyltransferase [Lentilactobacillus senioris]